MGLRATLPNYIPACRSEFLFYSRVHGIQFDQLTHGLNTKISFEVYELSPNIIPKKVSKISLPKQTSDTFWPISRCLVPLEFQYLFLRWEDQSHFHVHFLIGKYFKFLFLSPNAFIWTQFRHTSPILQGPITHLMGRVHRHANSGGSLEPSSQNLSELA